MNQLIKILLISIISISTLFCQNNELDNVTQSHSGNDIKNRHSIGASIFMLGNFLDDSPEYYLLTYGYRLTQKDRIFVEFNSWKYSEPLGTYGKSETLYPGFVRASGIGVGYQRFYWKGLYTTIQATSFVKQFHDIDGVEIQKGFQLYLQMVLGYRFSFFKERFYIEPAYAFKYWPVDTNFPEEFSEIETGAPKYIFEPSLNFGFRF